jgi:hypothetical protein
MNNEYYKYKYQLNVSECKYYSSIEFENDSSELIDTSRQTISIKFFDIFGEPYYYQSFSIITNRKDTLFFLMIDKNDTTFKIPYEPFNILITGYTEPINIFVPLDHQHRTSKINLYLQSSINDLIPVVRSKYPLTSSDLLEILSSLQKKFCDRQDISKELKRYTKRGISISYQL